jgi:hypothetical protein
MGPGSEPGAGDVAAGSEVAPVFLLSSPQEQDDKAAMIQMAIKAENTG